MTSPSITPQDVGTIRDVFGLMTPDKKRARPENLRKFMGTETTMGEVAEVMQVKRTAGYKNEVLLKELVRTKLVFVVASADFAADLFEDMEKAREWMLYPNTYFFGLSPFEVCMRGDGAAVLELLIARLGKATDGNTQKAGKEKERS